MSHHPDSLPTVGPAPARSDPDAFDDGDEAATLRLLATVYEPSTARLLRLCSGLAVRRALDSGCGAGWSTRLVHGFLGPHETLGVDRSPDLIARARELAPPGVEYVVGDAAAADFPGERPDFLYGRFILGRLREPERAIAGWAEAAADHATLVIEEVAELESDHPTFARTYALASELQRRLGRRPHLGQGLTGAPAGSGWRTDLGTLRRLSLPAARMARIHVLELATWGRALHGHVELDGADLDALARALAAIAAGNEPAPPVRAVIRQLVMSKG